MKPDPTSDKGVLWFTIFVGVVILFYMLVRWLLGPFSPAPSGGSSIPPL